MKIIESASRHGFKLDKEIYMEGREIKINGCNFYHH